MEETSKTGDITQAPYPQQRTFEFPDLVITSEFDSGNLT
jgi:hypothetical protein